MANPMELDRLLRQHPELRRGPDVAETVGGMPTGLPVLDRQLMGGGWPRRALTELLVSGKGAYALELLLPALAGWSRQAARWIALIAPPWLPYAPALQARGVALNRLLLIDASGRREGLWALEQTLRSGDCSAVLAWPRGTDRRALRRLQLAAEAGDSSGFLFRPLAVAAEPSPAPLRLRVMPTDSGWEVDVLKRPGGWPRAGIRISGNTPSPVP